MVSCLCPCRRPVISGLGLDVLVFVVVSPVSLVAVAAAVRPRVRLAAVAAARDALHAQLVVAVVGVRLAAPVSVVVSLVSRVAAVAAARPRVRLAVVAASLDVPHAQLVERSELARRDALLVAPDRDLFAQQVAVAEPGPELVPVARLGPYARLAPGTSVPSRDPMPDSHASSWPNQA